MNGSPAILTGRIFDDRGNRLRAAGRDDPDPSRLALLRALGWVRPSGEPL
jgi:hypothetical protein